MSALYVGFWRAERFTRYAEGGGGLVWSRSLNAWNAFRMRRPACWAKARAGMPALHGARCFPLGCFPRVTPGATLMPPLWGVEGGWNPGRRRGQGCPRYSRLGSRRYTVRRDGAGLRDEGADSRRAAYGVRGFFWAAFPGLHSPPQRRRPVVGDPGPGLFPCCPSGASRRCWDAAAERIL